MISIYEIRVGNLFIGYDDKPFYFGINNFRDVFEFVELDEIIKKPITITSAQLENMGFMCINRISQTFKRYVDEESTKCLFVELKQVGNPIWKIGFLDKWSNSPVFMEVEFIHELQNFWFVNTKYELIQSSSVLNDS